MSRQYDVYGLGHALVDLQYKVSTDFLAAQNITKGIMTLIDGDRQQTLFQALPEIPVESASGGSAANTMIALAGFGGSSYFACLVADDHWGDFYLQDLRQAGVHSNPGSRGSDRTGQCIVMITPDADRTLNTFLGASAALGPAQVDQKAIAASHYIYLEGYLLSSDGGFEACRLAQRLAQRNDTAVSLTLSDPFAVESCRQRFEQLVETGVDLLFANEEEARSFTGAEDTATAVDLLTQRVGTACVTCGRAGAVLGRGAQRVAIPGLAVEAVDTNGAGDAFAGGTLYGFTHGHDLAAAGTLGCYAAAQVVSRLGPRLETSLKDHINTILATANSEE
ncbi:MAG: adenosine kinase [Candidatus Latescibacteria bacterium]|nr:adenosine kinase [Candidatus Latescibacterota bacterium]